MDQTITAARDLFYLFSCRLRDIPCDPARLEQMQLRPMLSLAQQHTLGAMACMSFEHAGLLERLSLEDAAALKTIRDKAVRKVLLLDAGRQEMFRFLDANHIWHMPLKGVILKDCYPALGMRQMSDNDILYDSACQQQVRDFMISRGYTAVKVGKSHEDVYQKPPVYHYELHTRLFDPHSTYAYAYYGDMLRRCSRQGYLYAMTQEDFYLYFLAHAYKHYSGGGTGLRHLLDCWVFLQKHGDALDWAYIRRELKLLGLTDFEAESQSLSLALLDAPQRTLTEEESRQLAYYISSGTYGTRQRWGENMTAARMQQMHMDPAAPDKKRYLWHRLFPGEAYYRTYAPFCVRHVWARPFFGVYRLFRMLLDPRRRRRVQQETKTLQKQSSQKRD